MDCVEKNQFLFRWRIKKFLYTDFYNKYPLSTPKFKAKDLRDSGWYLELFVNNCTKIQKKHLEICLSLRDYDKASVEDGKIFLNFRFKLLSSHGEFSIVSPVLNYAFEKNTYSIGYPIIKREDLLKQMRIWSEDTIIVMCYMECANNDTSPMVQEKQGIDCEAESICVNHSRSFDCCFKFNNHENWSESKKLADLNITYELTLRYINNKIRIECLLISEDDWEHTISCSIDVSNDSGKKITSINEISWFINNEKVRFLNWITKQQLEETGCFTQKEIRLRGKFKRICSGRLSYPKNKNNSEINFAAALNKQCVPRLQRDLGNLLLDKYFTDVKLRVDNEIFPAHKNILASRSPVFLAMFNHEVVESNTGIVYICDVDTRSMKLFLEFLYTEEMREIDEEIAMSMLMLADKYQVTSLKEVSSKFLMSVLSVNNACNILSAADMLNCIDLKSSAAEYIVEHSKRILSSSEWSRWTKDNIALATEVLLRLSNKFSNS